MFNKMFSRILFNMIKWLTQQVESIHGMLDWLKLGADSHSTAGALGRVLQGSAGTCTSLPLIAPTS